jgi:hypothetical protein
MRIGMVSVLSTSLALICPPPPAAAQLIPGGPQQPQASFRKLPSPANLSQFQSGAESGSVGSFTSLRNAPADLPWSLRNWANQQEGADATRVPSAAETSQCAHIVVYRAPTMDSKMIIEAPKESPSDMPKLQGLHACCEDFRGAMGIPPLGPFVAPRRMGGLVLRPGVQLYPFRPQSGTQQGRSGRIP